MKLKPALKLTLLALMLGLSVNAYGAQKSVARATRDWTKHPAVIEVDTTEDIYAVGDPHADYERLVGVLTSAKLIAGKPAKPSEVVWTAGKAVLVITGDMIDKGFKNPRPETLCHYHAFHGGRGRCDNQEDDRTPQRRTREV